MASPSRKTRKALLGKKVGMTQVFTEEGKMVPVTVLQAGPCAVLQVKTEAKDGYSAVQLGFDDRRKAARKPQQAHYDAIGVHNKYFVREVPFVDEGDVLGDTGATDAEEGGESEASEEAAAEEEKGGVQPGALVGVGVFKETARVDVGGLSKGRGFAGTIKRHGFASGDKAHGSKNVREPGSTGMHTDPGRVIKGKKMPGQYGNVQRKVMNLEVVRVDEERNLLLVKGAVPGPNGGYLYIEESLR